MTDAQEDNLLKLSLSRGISTKSLAYKSMDAPVMH